MANEQTQTAVTDYNAATDTATKQNILLANSPNFNPKVPTTFDAGTVKSAFSGGSPTTFDLGQFIAGNQAKQDEMIKGISALFSPTTEETALSSEVVRGKQNLANFDVQTTRSILGREGRGEGELLPAIRGDQQKIQQQRALDRTSLTNELQANIDLLANQQATRSQKIQAATFVFDATKNRLNDTIALYKSLAPESLGTKVDETTGNVLVITRNPLTGEVTTQTAGNVKVTSPFYKFDTPGDQTVYTRDGKALPSREAYVAAGGNGKFTDVQIISTKTAPKLEFGVIGEDDFGNKKYGFIDTTSGTVKPFSSASPGQVVSTNGPYGLPLMDTESTNPGVVRANRNNNPGNVKVSAFTAGLPGVIGVESKAAGDGGNFLIFDTPENGANAIGYLLLNGKSYQNVNAEKALRAYSGSGYGAQTVGLDPKKDFQEQIRTPGVLEGVISNILKAEGYVPSANAANPGNVNFVANAKIDPNNLPKIPGAKISAETATKYNVPLGITEGQLNYIIKNRPGNNIFQTLKEDEFTKIADLIALRDRIDEIDRLGGRVQTGPVTGSLAKAISSKVGGGEAIQRLDILSGRQLAEYIKSISGAAVTEAEAQRLSALSPNIAQTETRFRENVKLLRENYDKQIATTLSRLGFSNVGELKRAVGAGEGAQSLVPGSIVQNAQGQRGLVNPDGSITIIE